MKVRKLILCSLLLGACQLQANIIADGYNRLYNGILYLIGNQRVINNAIDSAGIRNWSDKVSKQNMPTCGFDAYKNGKWVYQYLNGTITKRGLFGYLLQNPEQTAYQLSAWRHHLNQDNDIDDGQVYALRAQDKGVAESDFVVIPTISTFAQNIANNDFNAWTDPLVYVPHVAKVLTDIQHAILNGTKKTVVFILGNMAPQIIEHENGVEVRQAYGHWRAFVVNVRNKHVTLFTLDSSKKAIIVPDEFKTDLEQIKTSFVQLLKMNPKSISTCGQQLIAQQLPNLLQDAYNKLYTNNDPVSSMDIIETLLGHYKNIVGTQAGQSVNDQAGFVLNMIVEIMHQAIATDNNGLAQKAALCISTQPFADIIAHQIMDDSAKKQFVLKAHTLLMRFPGLLDNAAFPALVGTIAQQYPELENNNQQALFPTPAERVPAPCCFALIQQEQMQAAICPACGSQDFAQLVQAQNPHAQVQQPAQPVVTAITPCCLQAIPQDILTAGLDRCPLCDSDQFAQLMQEQVQANGPAHNIAPSAPPIIELQNAPSRAQRIAQLKQDARQQGMTDLGYAIFKKDLEMANYILGHDKPSVYNDEIAKIYIADAQEDDLIARAIKAYLLNGNLECPICFEVQSVNDFSFAEHCGHSVCKDCMTSLVQCPICNDTF